MIFKLALTFTKGVFISTTLSLSGLTNSRLAGGEMAESAAVLSLEILRRSALAVVANLLIENTQVNTYIFSCKMQH